MRFLKQPKPKVQRPEIKRNTGLRAKVWERDQGFCSNGCGFDAKWIHDHIVQLAADGDDTLENSQTLCRKCVRRKDSADAKARAKADRLASRHALHRQRRAVTYGE